LFGRERWSWPRGRLQLDSVRQGLRRSPFGEPDFADGKGGNETEFVRGRVERIPERLEHASAFLGEHLFGPDGFINLSLPGFERLNTGRNLVADPAAETAGLDRDGGIAPRWDHPKRCADEHEAKQDDGKKKLLRT